MILLLIIEGILLRVLPHPANFTPITAVAILSGVYLPKKWAIFIPIITLASSDYLLLYLHPFSQQFLTLNSFHSPTELFYSTTPFVWGSFMISSLIGLTLRKHNRFMNILRGSIIASVQFFIITNFGVWAVGYYPQNWSGLIESYTMGLPFYRNTLIGDIFYTSLLFGSFRLGLQFKSLWRQSLN